ncbi:TcfC E-set like domain-containing protein [Parendozoicomonas haliclonae]|uniref:TcfC E-set like domain-containing protein n=1 Tax=Parendozoicomonas haliclonae TaxID=1960125 RepID=UPI0013FE4B2C|nr:TcfC E-set like domain-containing protein [Parendozoicomonas haliclonae]
MLFSQHSLFFIVLWSLLAPVIACAELFVASASPPKGFELLTEPWQTMVDVYYGSRYLVAAHATIYPDAIEFSDPAAIAKAVPHVLNPVAVAAALTGRINSHTGQVCQNGQPAMAGEQSCGWIHPVIAGVIFDEQRFRATVFVAPEYLEQSALNRQRYLSPPTSMEPGFIQRLSLSSSGVWSEGSHTVLYGQTYLSKGADDIEASWDVAEGYGVHLSSLYIDREYEGIDLRGGYQRTAGFGYSFTPDQPIIGVHLGTSENTYLDLIQMRSTPLDVFLPSRGRVEIFKDGLLLQAWMLDAGSHPLNTSRFPSGAYEITIKILGEGNQLISEETRFFVNQARLPPSGFPLWFVEGGRVTKESQRGIKPELSDFWLLRGGYTQRLGNRWGSVLAAAATQQAGLVETGILWVSQYLNLSPSFLLSNRGDKGYRIDGQLTGTNFFINANYRKLTIHHKPEPVLFGSNTESFSTSANTRLWNGVLQYRYLRIGNTSLSGKLEHQPEQHTVSYSRTLLQDRSFQLEGRIEAMIVADDRRLFGGLNFRLRNDRFQQAFIAQVSRQDSGGSDRETSAKGSYDISFNEIKTGDGRLSGHGWGSVEKEQWGTGGTLNYMSMQGSINGSVSYSKSTRSSNEYAAKSWAVGAVTNLSYKDGHIIFGGDFAANSMLVVQVNDAPKSSEFQVLVNDQVRGRARGGLASIIPLAPFQSYRIRLQAVGTGLFNYDDNEREVTLYPGNVVLQSFSAHPVKLVFGQLLDKSEQPWAGVSVCGGDNCVVTDDFGIYQLEIPANKEQLSFKQGKQVVGIVNLDYVVETNKNEILRPIVNLGSTQLNAVRSINKNEGVSLGTLVEESQLPVPDNRKTSEKTPKDQKCHSIRPLELYVCAHHPAVTYSLFPGKTFWKCAGIRCSSQQ